MIRFQNEIARINQHQADGPRGRAVKSEDNGNDLHLWAYGPIGGYYDGVDAQSFNQAVQGFRGESITVHVNSEGGDVFAGVSMYNAIANASAETTVINEGLAASAASVLMQAGDKRVMETGSRLMIHKAWTVGVGNADEFRQIADVLDGIDADLVDLYKASTTIDDSELTALLSSESWFGAQEAVDRGFADQVGLTDVAETAENSFKRYHDFKRRQLVLTNLRR